MNRPCLNKVYQFTLGLEKGGVVGIRTSYVLYFWWINPRIPGLILQFWYHFEFVSVSIRLLLWGFLTQSFTSSLFNLLINKSAWHGMRWDQMSLNPTECSGWSETECERASKCRLWVSCSEECRYRTREGLSREACKSATWQGGRRGFWSHDTHRVLGYNTGR